MARKSETVSDVTTSMAIMETGDLKAALASVVGAVERKNTIPILANVMLSFAPGQLVVHGTNLDMLVTRQVPAESVDASWATTVDAHVLKAMADKLPSGGEVSLAWSAGKLTVRSGRARYELPTLPEDDFPVFGADGDWLAQFEMVGAELLAMVNHVKHAISTEETRFYLNGIAVERREAELFMVATDGHRLAVAARPAPDGSEAMADHAPLIVPRAALPMIEAMAKESRVEIAISSRMLRVDAGEVVLICKLIDGTYPDWRRVVPSANDRIVEFDPAVLRAAVERVVVVASDKTRAVRIDVDADRITLTVTSPENGQAVEEISCAYSGEALQVGTNSVYLLAILSRFAGDHGQMVMAGHPAAPILFRSSEAATDRAVLMPMRV